VLLPAVRRASAATLIVADGFSCREQIAQGTERRAVHLADALQLALRARDRGDSRFVEDTVLEPPRIDRFPRRIAAAALIAAGIGLAAVQLRIRN
jgi:hypothetical protein